MSYGVTGNMPSVQSAIGAEQEFQQTKSEVEGKLVDKRVETEEHKFDKAKSFREKLMESMKDNALYSSVLPLIASGLGMAFLGPWGAALVSGAATKAGQKWAASNVKDDMQGYGFKGNLEKIISDWDKQANKNALISAVTTGAMGKGLGVEGGAKGFGVVKGDSMIKKLFTDGGFVDIAPTFGAATTTTKTLFDLVQPDVNPMINQPTYDQLIK